MPKLNRKANYSLSESRFLVEKFKLHAAYFENNWTNGSRFEKTEVWQDIFEQYCEQFPHTDRTALDIRRKLIKLRSEAKMIMQREQLKAEGANIQELLSERTLRLSVSPAHRMMMKAMKGHDDWAADSGDFVEYEVEFADEEAQNDDDDDVEYVGDDDEEDQSDNVNPERIIKKLFHPAGAPIAMALAQKQDSTKKNPATSEPTPKKRRHNAQDISSSSSSMNKTIADDLLHLQKQKLEMERRKLSIECDNLLLMQKKLKLEVRLIEQQLAQSDVSSSNWDKKGKKGGVSESKKSLQVPAVEETVDETDSENTGQENREENGQEGVQEETEVPEENGQEETEVPEENGQEETEVPEENGN